MTLLNLCCGATRVVDDTWINLDSLHDVLQSGTPERANLDAEPNYVNWNIPQDGKLPFADEKFDGILASHCFEHWDCQQGAAVMKECRRILKPGGTLMVSVPDALTFQEHHDQDTFENAVHLFGEPIYLLDGETTFAGYALWNRFHKVILSEDTLWPYFIRAGFDDDSVWTMNNEYVAHPDSSEPEAVNAMFPLLNRLKFSVVMTATK